MTEAVSTLTVKRSITVNVRRKEGAGLYLMIQRGEDGAVTIQAFSDHGVAYLTGEEWDEIAEALRV